MSKLKEKVHWVMAASKEGNPAEDAGALLEASAIAQEI